MPGYGDSAPDDAANLEYVANLGALAPKACFPQSMGSSSSRRKLKSIFAAISQQPASAHKRVFIIGDELAIHNYEIEKYHEYITDTIKAFENDLERLKDIFSDLKNLTHLESILDELKESVVQILTAFQQAPLDITVSFSAMSNENLPKFSVLRTKLTHLLFQTRTLSQTIGTLSIPSGKIERMLNRADILIINQDFHQKILQISRDQGDSLARKAQECVDQYKLTEQVEVIRWANVKSSAKYKEYQSKVNQFYEQDPTFKAAFENSAAAAAESKAWQHSGFDKETRKQKCLEYILEEAPLFAQLAQEGYEFYYPNEINQAIAAILDKFGNRDKFHKISFEAAAKDTSKRQMRSDESPPLPPSPTPLVGSPPDELRLPSLMQQRPSARPKQTLAPSPKTSGASSEILVNVLLNEVREGRLVVVQQSGAFVFAAPNSGYFPNAQTGLLPPPPMPLTSNDRFSS